MSSASLVIILYAPRLSNPPFNTESTCSASTSHHRHSTLGISRSLKRDDIDFAKSLTLVHGNKSTLHRIYTAKGGTAMPSFVSDYLIISPLDHAQVVDQCSVAAANEIT